MRDTPTVIAREQSEFKGTQAAPAARDRDQNGGEPLIGGSVGVSSGWSEEASREEPPRLTAYPLFRPKTMGLLRVKSGINLGVIFELSVVLEFGTVDHGFRLE